MKCTGGEREGTVLMFHWDLQDNDVVWHARAVNYVNRGPFITTPFQGVLRRDRGHALLRDGVANYEILRNFREVRVLTLLLMEVSHSWRSMYHA